MNKLIIVLVTSVLIVAGGYALKDIAKNLYNDLVHKGTDVKIIFADFKESSARAEAKYKDFYAFGTIVNKRVTKNGSLELNFEVPIDDFNILNLLVKGGIFASLDNTDKITVNHFKEIKDGDYVKIFCKQSNSISGIVILVNCKIIELN